MKKYLVQKYRSGLRLFYNSMDNFQQNKKRNLLLTLSGILLIAVILTFSIKLFRNTKNISTTTKLNTENRAIFAVVENLKMNIYSSKIDGSDKKIIISQQISEPETRARPFTVIDFKVSPDKNLIAYKFPSETNYTVSSSTSVFLADTNGQNIQKILNNVENFYWSPDSKKIMYSELSTRKDGPNFGMAFSSPGAEWHIFDIESSADTIVAKPDQQLHKLGSWISENKAIFISSNITGSEIIVYNLALKNSQRIKLPNGYTQVSQISTNPSGNKTVVSLLPESYGINYSCDFFEVESNGKLGKHFIADKNYSCEGFEWNGDDEIYYGKGTGPNGYITTSESSESGYYILLSVFKYDFKTGKDQPIVISEGKNVYRFQNVLKNSGVVVSNESNKRDPRYILEMRNLDGSNPRQLFTSDKEMLFIGWGK